MLTAKWQAFASGLRREGPKKKVCDETTTVVHRNRIVRQDFEIRQIRAYIYM